MRRALELLLSLNSDIGITTILLLATLPTCTNVFAIVMIIINVR